MRLARGILVLLATMLAATACTSEPDPEPTPTPTPTPTVSPTPTPTPSPSPSPSPEPSPSPTLSPDQQAAVDTVLEYFRIGDEVRGDLDADFQPLADITRDAAQRFIVEEVARHRSEGTYQQGVVAVTIVGVDEPRDVDGETWIRVRACTDNSSIDVVDFDTGVSVLDPDRAREVFWALDVVYDNGFRWKITSGGNEVREPCM